MKRSRLKNFGHNTGDEQEKISCKHHPVHGMSLHALYQEVNVGEKTRDVGESPPGESNDKLTLAESFVRLANSDGSVLERIGRYEACLWRQAAQTIYLLDALGAKSLPSEAGLGRPGRGVKRRRYSFERKSVYDRL